jgi:hypothetical protein
MAIVDVASNLRIYGVTPILFNGAGPYYTTAPIDTSAFQKAMMILPVLLDTSAVSPTVTFDKFLTSTDNTTYTTLNPDGYILGKDAGAPIPVGTLTGGFQNIMQTIGFIGGKLYIVASFFSTDAVQGSHYMLVFWCGYTRISPNQGYPLELETTVINQYRNKFNEEYARKKHDGRNINTKTKRL